MRYILRRTAFVLTCAGLACAQDGAAVYKQNCASCHDGGNDRAPSRESLRAMAPERVLNAMEAGPMISMASRLKAMDRRALAEYVTGKIFSQAFDTKPSAKAMCSTASTADFSNPLTGAV